MGNPKRCDVIDIQEFRRRMCSHSLPGKEGSGGEGNGRERGLACMDVGENE